MASALVTGSAPGRPRHVGQQCVLGSSPKLSSHEQNILVFVASWTWISRPMTVSNMGSPGLEPDGLLERVGRVHHPVLAERRAGELEADRQGGRAPPPARAGRGAGA